MADVAQNWGGGRADGPLAGDLRDSGALEARLLEARARRARALAAKGASGRGPLVAGGLAAAPARRFPFLAWPVVDLPIFLVGFGIGAAAVMLLVLDGPLPLRPAPWAAQVDVLLPSAARTEPPAWPHALDAPLEIASLAILARPQNPRAAAPCATDGGGCRLEGAHAGRGAGRGLGVQQCRYGCLIGPSGAGTGTVGRQRPGRRSYPRLRPQPAAPRPTGQAQAEGQAGLAAGIRRARRPARHRHRGQAGSAAGIRRARRPARHRHRGQAGAAASGR